MRRSGRVRVAGRLMVMERRLHEAANVLTQGQRHAWMESWPRHKFQYWRCSCQLKLEVLVSDSIAAIGREIQVPGGLRLTAWRHNVKAVSSPSLIPTKRIKYYRRFRETCSSLPQLGSLVSNFR